KLKLDAFVYPTWSNPPRLIGDLNTPHGDNSQFYSPTTGFPAINVPMGFTRGGTLPAGMTFYGRAWSEPRLLKLAYAYEQATHHHLARSDARGRDQAGGIDAHLTAGRGKAQAVASACRHGGSHAVRVFEPGLQAFLRVGKIHARINGERQ